MAPIDEEIQTLYVAHEQLSGEAAPLITSKSKMQGLCMCFKGLEHRGRSVIGGCCTSTLNERSILSSLIEKKYFYEIALTISSTEVYARFVYCVLKRL